MVIVLNDDHNTFDHVAQTLARVIPGISLDQGYSMADRIHNSGRAAVWTGPKETAELYWEQLSDAGLTMAPLEQHRSGRVLVAALMAMPGGANSRM
jgi:ATP-dependent Clp protease adaptor protein ClpS